MLRSLEGEGLVTVAPDPDDRRRRRATLTPQGEREHAELDARSDARARDLLTGLTPRQQERLVGAMEEVERLLSAALVEIEPVDPEHPDAVSCVQAYFDELRRRDGVRPGREPQGRAGRGAPAARPLPARRRCAARPSAAARSSTSPAA